MEKVVRGLSLTLLVLVIGSSANAGWTTVVYNQAVTSDVTLNKTYTWGGGGVGWHYQVSWDHEWMIPSDPNIVSANITDADLGIESQGTSGKTENVFVASTSNPSLGDLVDGWTSFDVLSYADDLDGDVTIYAKLFDNAPEDYMTVVLKKSKLDLVYEITERVWEPDPIPPEPVVPAPAALVLSSLGAGLVAWLRRRGTV